jgi:hypothetical protein
MRILVAYQGDYGLRKLKNLQKNGPAEWKVASYRLPKALPIFIDDPEELLPPTLPPADLLLALGENPAVGDLIAPLARLAGVKSALVPIDNDLWVPPGLARQLKAELRALGVAAVFPRPLCSLTREFSGYGAHRESYQDPWISEFASHFGAPEVKIQVDAETKTVRSVEVVRDAVCGCTRYVAEKLVGIAAAEAEMQAGLIHHHYPCWASMEKVPVDEGYEDTLMHLSGYVLKASVAEQVKPFLPPPTYFEPGEKA